MRTWKVEDGNCVMVKVLHLGLIFSYLVRCAFAVWLVRDGWMDGRFGDLGSARGVFLLLRNCQCFTLCSLSQGVLFTSRIYGRGFRRMKNILRDQGVRGVVS